MNSLPFYLFLFLHLVSFIVAFGSVIVIDSFGFLFLVKKLGVTLKLVNSVANITQRLIWLGFFGLIISGVPMLVMKGSVDELTKLKLFFVVLLGLNGVFLHLIKRSLEKMGEVEELPAHIGFRVGLASFISQLGWWGALIIGFLHRQWKHEINWPHNGLLLGAFIVIILLIVGFVGEAVLARKLDSLKLRNGKA